MTTTCSRCGSVCATPAASRYPLPVVAHPPRLHAADRGYYILHEGLLGVLGGTLKEQNYATAKTEGDKKGGVSFESTAPAAGPASPTNTGW